MLRTILRRALPDRTDRQAGNVIIAVLIVMAVSFALVATLTAVMGGLRQSRVDQNRNNAFQFANAGIDQALFWIDRNEGKPPQTVQGTYTPVITSGVLTGFTDTVSITNNNGVSRFDVTVQKDPRYPPEQNAFWIVRSTGTDPSGRQRLAIASVQATPLFLNGFFTVRDFYLTGQQDSPRAYNSATCPTADVTCELPTPIQSRLGTNGRIIGADATVESFANSWGGFNMYGRATQAEADFACAEGPPPPHGCGTFPKVQPITDQLQVPLPRIPSLAQGCPAGGNLGSTNGAPTIAPGSYVCDAGLNIQGTLDVSGTGDARIWITGPLSVASGAVVNRHQVPKRLQFFQTETPGGGSICGAEIWALMYTPGLPIDCNGEHQPKIYGAVVAQIHSGTGNHFDFHWDADSIHTLHDGKFVVKSWRECPIGASDC